MTAQIKKQIFLALITFAAIAPVFFQVAPALASGLGSHGGG